MKRAKSHAEGSYVKIPEYLSLKILIYPSVESENIFVAHCLELNVIGCDKNVEGACDILLQCIESYLDACEEHSIPFMHPAPPSIWEKFAFAKSAGRKLPPELLERIIRNANTRLGHRRPSIDDHPIDVFRATEGIPEKCLMANE